MFGFGSPSELSTPLGLQVKAATDSLRLVPDWNLNLQICDQISRNRGDSAQSVLNAIRRRLQDNDPQTVYLALLLMESCMKNCGIEFVAAVDRATLNEVANVGRGTKGPKNTDEALRLIATWARAFQSTFPIFYDTFMGLKSRGVRFPPEDEAAIRTYTGAAPGYV